MYHLFAGYEYYPAGGMGDYLGVFPTREFAAEFLFGRGFDWYQIVTVGDDGRLVVV